MKKRTMLFAVSAVFAVGACCLAGCGHEHGYSEAWSSDAENHWHACEGCEEKKDEAVHVWNGGTVAGEEKKYTCTVCGKEKIEAVVHDYTVTQEQWAATVNAYSLRDPFLFPNYTCTVRMNQDPQKSESGWITDSVIKAAEKKRYLAMISEEYGDDEYYWNILSDAPDENGNYSYERYRKYDVWEKEEGTGGISLDGFAVMTLDVFEWSNFEYDAESKAYKNKEAFNSSFGAAVDETSGKVYYQVVSDAAVSFSDGVLTKITFKITDEHSGGVFYTEYTFSDCGTTQITFPEIG